jgi:hypothetical protein
MQKEEEKGLTLLSPAIAIFCSPLQCTHDARALEETATITVVPRRESTNAPGISNKANSASVSFFDTSSTTVAEASFTDIDLGYATEDWLLDSDTSPPLPCPPSISNDSSNSHLECLMNMAEYPIASESDSSSLWWHNLTYPTNSSSTMTCWADPLEAGLLSSQNWSIGLDPAHSQQLEKFLEPEPSPSTLDQYDSATQALATAVLPLDGYLADSEDEAYGSCEEKKARIAKHGKRQPSSEPRTIAPSDLVR